MRLAERGTLDIATDISENHFSNYRSFFGL
jgi:hypothetical protein